MHLDYKDSAVHYLDTCFTAGWSVIVSELCSAGIINNKYESKLTNYSVLFFALKLRGQLSAQY